ncbi:hypothetical protein CAPTEDRAFT_194828 [Capitella teleta]|uniref:G-protein coupled receptors family 1 profile domain-containing protein n=1 Tax=Capitella teleta TaxID=283909 RepID=R7T3K0_CAPTE|nr:hypothetical protein CAPTEDRAFT_194828 [Capitella teleta]|eukprot:ELT87186.1 hypothetical protein CAPTEDRAFT_194828 [Capitella teleta]
MDNFTLSNSTEVFVDKDPWERQFHDILFEYIGPFLLAIGTAGNVICICVLRSQTFKGKSHALLLAALAIADIGVLYTGLLRHLIKVHAGVDIRVYSRGSCKVHYFFTYLFPHLSSWTLVLVTLERLMSLWIPLRVKEICSLRRMTAVWLGMTTVLVAVNVHWLVMTDLRLDGQRVKCGYSQDHLFVFEHVMTWLDFALLSFIPLSIIIPSNCLIMTKVYSASKSRQRDLGLTSHVNKSLTSVNVMLLVVTSFFVFTTSPIVIYFVAFDEWPFGTTKEKAQTYMAYSICNMLYYLNSAVNFFLYCISGSHFRQAFMSCSRSAISRKSQRQKSYSDQLQGSRNKRGSTRSTHTVTTRLGNNTVFGRTTSIELNGIKHEISL